MRRRKHVQVGGEDVLRRSHGHPGIVHAAMLPVKARRLHTDRRAHAIQVQRELTSGLHIKQVVDFARLGGGQQAAVVGVGAIVAVVPQQDDQRAIARAG